MCGGVGEGEGICVYLTARNWDSGIVLTLNKIYKLKMTL